MFLRELYEGKETVGIIFGRFNPPHQGHKAAWELASKCDRWFVGTNQSTVGPKDPLPFDVKVEAMSAIWPEVADHIVAEQSWLTLASKVYKEYGDVELICFTDEDWVTKTIVAYNGKEGAHGYYNFSDLKQQPTPRLSSATALRDAVVKGDREAFAQAAGVSADTPVAGHPFFDVVAHYLLPYANAPKKVAKKKVAEDTCRICGQTPCNCTYISETIVKTDGKYRLISKHGHKNLGTYPTKAGAEKRERQVQYFKHAGERVNLDEMAMDSMIVPKYGKLLWLNENGVHMIARREPTGSLNIFMMGTHEKIAKKWAELKNKYGQRPIGEECAGVGTVNKQNSTADVGPGTLRKNLKAFRLTDDVQKEAAYQGNLGMMELFKFFSEAGEQQPALVAKVKELIKQHKDNEVWQIVQHFTNTKLVGDEFQ